MDTKNLNYIKNVSNDKGWVYEDHSVSSYFLLHFHRREDSATVEHHALNLPKGSVIILSQRPPEKDRYLTHVVELVNDGIEDKPQWKNDEDYGVLRWVKVLWAANFSDHSTIPVDSEVLRANWGWYDTKAKLLNSPKLMTEWGDINSLRVHLGSIFN